MREDCCTSMIMPLTTSERGSEAETDGPERARAEVLVRVGSEQLRVVDAARLVRVSYRPAKRLWGKREKCDDSAT